MSPLNVLTWHVHGSYLYYLSHVPHRLYLPVKEGRPEGYGGRLPGLPWPANVVEVPAERVASLDLDVVLFQSRKNFVEDQFEILSSAQRRLPRIFLEHDPPRESPTETRHPVDDPDVLLVHVTAFNALMWNSRRTPTRVIEHGVVVPAGVRYTGEIERGLVVVNALPSRGRRLGADVFAAVRSEVPLELVGLESEAAGGLGEAGHDELPGLMARYRFLFNPIRYTSLGLAVCEAMMLGLPIVGLATTEMAAVVENGVSGYVDTRVGRLVERMRELLADPREAARLGDGARRAARRRFHIDRFVRDWNDALAEVAGRGSGPDRLGARHAEPRPMRRIAMISDHASPLAALGSADAGGQNVYVAHLTRRLADRGIEVDVFTRRDAADQPEVVRWYPNARVIHVPAGPPEPVPKEELLPHMDAFTRFVRRACRRRRYDLLHANFWMSGMTAAEVKRALDIPFVITFHALGRIRRVHQGANDRFPDSRFALEERIAWSADRVIAECPQDRLDLMTYYGADPERISIVPCGFDPSELAPVPKHAARAALGLPQDTFIVLQLGRLVPRKGIATAIEGFARFLRGTRADARLLIVGGDSYTPDPIRTPEIGRLSGIAADEGVSQRVIFTGRRDRHVLRYYYSAADVFVTLPWYEPFGITPLEAMACSVPVVGSRVGGVKYTVVDGVTGALIPAADPEALAARLARLHSDARMRASMGRAGRARVVRHFTWSHVACAVEAVYHEVLDDALSAPLKQAYAGSGAYSPPAVASPPLRSPGEGPGAAAAPATRGGSAVATLSQHPRRKRR